MTKAFKSNDFSIDENGKISGYASVFGNIDCYDDIIEHGAYNNVLDAQPKIFFNHDSFNVPLGTWTNLSVDEYGLKVEGQLNMDLQASKDIRSAILHGDVDGLSVSFLMQEEDFNIDDSGIRHITNVQEMPEISICTYPANDKARILNIKSKVDTCNSISDYERLLREVANFSKSEATAFISSLKSVLLKSERDAQTKEEQNSILINRINAISRGNKNGRI